MLVLSFSGRRFFALIIGINDFGDGEHPTIEGGVADADDIAALLTVQLSISHDCIINLRDEMATRTNIIQHILNLAKDDRITHGDPILIYFAGGGCSTGTHFCTYIPHGHRSPGITHDELYISSTRLNNLLAQLSAAKGNNIVCPSTLFLFFKFL